MMNSKQSVLQKPLQTLFISLAALIVFSALFIGLRAYEERVAVQAVRLAVEHRVDSVDYELAGKARDIDTLWAVYGPQQELSEDEFYSLADPIVVSHHTFLPLFISAMGGGLTFVLLGMALNLAGRNRAFNQEIKSKNLELERSRQKLAEVSITDELTGVYNQRHYLDLLDTESRRAVREFAPLTLLLAEIDAVADEQVTDSFTEESICRVAEVLNRNISRPGDVIARIDKRRFALLLPATNEQSPVLAEKLCQQVQAIEIGEQRLSLSIGLSTMQPSSELTAERIQQYTEEALQKAISKGGNQVCANTEAASEIPVTFAE